MYPTSTRELNEVMRAFLRKLVPTRFLPSSVLERYLRARTFGGTKVIKGPFEGLVLRSESYFSPIYNKLLGSYERELHPILEEVMAMSPSLVVDIGAAEGYYACGFASRCGPQTKHYAFESDFRSRFVLRRNLEANNLSSAVQVGEHCSTEVLQKLLNSSAGPVFIICDVEGMEAELLDADLVPGVRNATILAELHEFAVRGVGEFLTKRFESTHVVREIGSEPRSARDLFGDQFPLWAHFLPRSAIDRFAKERPGIQKWLFLQPRSCEGKSSGETVRFA